MGATQMTYLLKALGFVMLLLWQARNAVRSVVCRFKGHHYDTPVFHPKCLYFCTRCDKELLDRTFADLQPMTESEYDEFTFYDPGSQS